ncbi:hypothetical protein C4J98_1206 [Pseudomonas orientalis]|nr:hypothetical protein C4J98_1206 [Pseudomonas orientalis]
MSFKVLDLILYIFNLLVEALGASLAIASAAHTTHAAHAAHVCAARNPVDSCHKC